MTYKRISFSIIDLYKVFELVKLNTEITHEVVVAGVADVHVNNTSPSTDCTALAMLSDMIKAELIIVPTSYPARATPQGKFNYGVD